MSELSEQGRIVKILDIEKGVTKSGKNAGNEWQKMNFVIDTDAKYNSIICFQVFGQEKCENFLKYNKVGDLVEVKFNVSSREYDGRYYHNLDAWRVESLESVSAPTSDEDPFAHKTDSAPWDE